MFATMAVDHLLASFILLLICNTGFSEIHVFVLTGDSVQLDMQTEEQYTMTWTKDISEILTYTPHGESMIYGTFNKDRMDFNTETFSLTLKNVQKTDSGQYILTALGDHEVSDTYYRVSVIDPVEAPVLTVNSNWSSGNFCTVNFTCSAHDLLIHSSYQNNRCSPEEVTSREINTLTLDCSEESIICNHKNPVSWKKDRINIKQLCVIENERLPTPGSSSHMPVLFIVLSVVAVIMFAGLVLFCCWKYKDRTGDTDTVTYRTVGHQTPSSAHDC
ncbi:natural killer cell receptor 2B4-like [Pseudorasbora parva]|uniref:natural killer cell receptor 2B4-like n=1 Tax=Pseudorasbora parva TaxID=51549 RepID=UPI00351F3DAC